MNKKITTLFASPWIGEFGWELMCWSGFLRRLSKQYDRMIVVCRTGHDLLYQDFVDINDIIHYDPKCEETNMWMNEKEPNHFNFHQYYTSNLQNVTVIQNNKYQMLWWLSEKWNARQDFIPFDFQGVGFDVLLIVRDTAKCNTAYRNWPHIHATQFVNRMTEQGLIVACIGKSDSAAHIQGTVDLRDLPLNKLAQVMAASRVIVGPQSGPIHFATLCKLPQVCWQTKPEHASRTKLCWNPFNVPVITMPNNISYWKNRVMWLPSVQVIVDATLKMIKGDYK